MKGRWLLIAALVLAGVAVLSVELALRQARKEGAGELKTVFRAKAAIKTGEKVTAENVESATISANETALINSAVPRELYSLIENRPAFRPIPAGSIVQWQDFERTSEERLTPLVPPGYLAVAFPADERTAVGGLLQPGDRVDVYATWPRRPEKGPDASKSVSGVASEAGPAAFVTELVVENAEILATGHRTNTAVARFQPAAPEWQRYDTVTLAIQEAEIRDVLTRLHLAGNSIRFVLRPRTEKRGAGTAAQAGSMEPRS